MKGEIQAVAAKMARLTKAKEAADQELKGLQEGIDSSHRVLVEKQAQVRDADALVASLEAALKAKKLEVDRFLQVRYARGHAVPPLPPSAAPSIPPCFASVHKDVRFLWLLPPPARGLAPPQNYNALHKRTAQLTDELDSQMVTNEGIELDLKSIAEQVAASKKEAAAHEAETAKYVKLHDLAVVKVREAEEKSAKVWGAGEGAFPFCSMASS